MKTFVFLNFLEMLFKKKSILEHSGLLDMFLSRSPKITLKNSQNSPLYSILKLTFLKILKNESFYVSKFYRNFFFRLMPGFLKSPPIFLSIFPLVSSNFLGIYFDLFLQKLAHIYLKFFLKNVQNFFQLF